MMAINSLAPGKFEWNFRHVIIKKDLVIDDIHLKAILQKMPQPSIIKISLKITYPNFIHISLGGSELTSVIYTCKPMIFPVQAASNMWLMTS